jgi:hypothetical protein
MLVDLRKISPFGRNDNRFFFAGFRLSANILFGGIGNPLGLKVRREHIGATGSRP